MKQVFENEMHLIFKIFTFKHTVVVKTVPKHVKIKPRFSQGEPTLPKFSNLHVAYPITNITLLCMSNLTFVQNFWHWLGYSWMR